MALFSKKDKYIPVSYTHLGDLVAYVEEQTK